MDKSPASLQPRAGVVARAEGAQSAVRTPANAAARTQTAAVRGV